jgi:hypothetical protein
MTSKRKPLPALDPSVFANAAVPVADPVHVATTTKVTSPTKRADPDEPKTATREGKVQVQTWVTKEERMDLKILSAKSGKSVEQLLREAVQRILQA